MDTDNLLQNVRNFFLDQYKDLSKTNSYIAFEAIGHVIDPEDYISSQGEVNTAKANEDISEMVDKVPEISDVFIRGIGSISSQYEILIKAAVFNDKAIISEDKSAYITLLGEIKGDADKLLKEADLMSIKNAGDKFYPATTYPENWFDTRSAIWAHSEFHLSEATIQNPPVAAKSIDHKMQLYWKSIAVDKLTPAIINESSPLIKATIDKDFLAKYVEKIGLLEHDSTKQIKVIKDLADTQRSFKPVLPMSQLMPMLHDVVLAPIPEHGSMTEASQPKVVSKELLNFKSGLKTSMLAKSDFTKLVMNSPDLVETKPANSTNLSLSFDYSIVQINRFWFNTHIFDFSKLWFTMALPESSFSSGQRSSENRGSLRAIPKAFIIIKNLKIQASWTEVDKDIVKNSFGFGCFNLVNSSFNEEKSELTNPALQIIGWLCEVTPKTPLTADPNLSWN